VGTGESEWRLESLSGDSGESCGRPSKIPVRAMNSLILGPLGASLQGTCSDINITDIY